jgi:3'(2'), 5'-bisphosphate nucleotidase
MRKTDPNDNAMLQTAISAAIEGGKKILEIYGQDFTVDYKKDNSPLTLADRLAHDVISHILARTGLPVLSEEGKDIPYESRSRWTQFWLVDPLDGTKEFIKRNGEFTVNIALIRRGEPVLGVILVPVTGHLYFGTVNSGAYRSITCDISTAGIQHILDNSIPLPLAYKPTVMTVVCSRSHISPQTEEYIRSLREKEPDLEFISAGSSLKLCMIAEGRARIYPRFGPTMEWDTAAGHAIVNASGGIVRVNGSHAPLTYNKPDLLNPWFIASREQ